MMMHASGKFLDGLSVKCFDDLCKCNFFDDLSVKCCDNQDAKCKMATSQPRS